MSQTGSQRILCVWSACFSAMPSSIHFGAPALILPGETTAVRNVHLQRPKRQSGSVPRPAAKVPPALPSADAPQGHEVGGAKGRVSPTPSQRTASPAPCGNSASPAPSKSGPSAPSKSKTGPAPGKGRAAPSCQSRLALKPSSLRERSEKEAAPPASAAEIAFEVAAKLAPRFEELLKAVCSGQAASPNRRPEARSAQDDTPVAVAIGSGDVMTSNSTINSSIVVARRRLER
mmetsp:Transcript_33963/g.72063  ORF Transcript_33963/g.72063 Transcript_33963/m.72063 type:complete len:232 (-) Transcript_33963:574-1269(-)